MSRRKRGPPSRLSYREKERQLKDSGFKISLRAKSPLARKALITRYHRVIFGGKDSKGKFHLGLTSNYQPYTGKHSKLLRTHFIGDRRIPNIKSGIIPIGYKVEKVNGTFDLIGPYDRRTVYKLNKQLLATDVKRALARLPKSGKFRVQVGHQLLSGTFESRNLITQRIEQLHAKYGDDFMNNVNVVTVKMINQKSKRAYRKAKANAKRSRH